MDAQKIEKKKKKKHKHRRIKTFNFPGVERVILEPDVQILLCCSVGVNVTSEKPWKKIKKDIILQELNKDKEEMLPLFEPFLLYLNEIQEYPYDDMLLGYIPDESRDYDEFYFCLTVAAEQYCEDIIKQMELQQAERLQQTICRSANKWLSLGSEEDVDESIPQKSRGLLKIELETKYPIMIPEVRFKPRNVEHVRDGYVELLVPIRYAIPYIFKKRVDKDIQVAPAILNRPAQTICTYPKNSWTQYEYTYKEIKKLSREFIANFVDFYKYRKEDINNILGINGTINLYTNDYSLLATKRSHGATQDYITEEYTSFKDIKRCKDKMISGISWHPMWSGVIACAYANNSPCWIHKSRDAMKDQLSEIVHGMNPVLIWSFNDTLFPKLILETYSEVHCLAFCPHDENILVGGCANGQVILWDIKHKLNRVEEEEILTPEQQKYRTLMFSMMKWMKNTRDYSLIPTTATSQLKRSHISNVTEICWMDPNYEINSLGQIKRLEEGTYSMQFVSSSSDGTLQFWDLKQNPVLEAGDYKPVRKSRRLGKRPSALTLDVSPYRILHRKMSPIFKLSIELPRNQMQISIPVRSISFVFDELEYEPIDKEAYQKAHVNDRLYFTPKTKEVQDMYQEILIGTYSGDVLYGAWEGFDYHSGETICGEIFKPTIIQRYHDGPVVTVKRHPCLKNICLSVGGKIFCVWNTEFKGKPILWRATKYKYAYGSWSTISPCSLRLNRSDGNRELWDLNLRTDRYDILRAHSGGVIMEGLVHPMKLKTQTLAIADIKGSLRLVLTHQKVNYDKQLRQVKRLFEQNTIQIQDFLKWQERWTDKYATWIKKQIEEAKAEAARKKALKEQQLKEEEERRAQEAIEAAKRAAAKLKPPPGKYEEWAQENWIVKEQERMGNVLLSMKRLDKETLIKQQAPLKKIEIAEERKRHKQKVQLQKSDIIFKNTIAMLFPDLVETKPTQKLSIKPSIICPKEDWMLAYDEIKNEMDSYIEENPFIYQFDWKEILETAKIKKKEKDFNIAAMHSIRQKMKKHPSYLEVVQSQAVVVEAPRSSESSSQDDFTTNKFAKAKID